MHQPPHPVGASRQMTVTEMEAAAQRLMNEADELRRFARQRRIEDERQRFVQVQFHGSRRVYTYEIALDGPALDEGDYVMVRSPLSEQDKLVRVVGVGRGTWTLPTKRARRISITPID